MLGVHELNYSTLVSILIAAHEVHKERPEEGKQNYHEDVACIQVFALVFVVVGKVLLDGLFVVLVAVMGIRRYRHPRYHR